MSQNLVSWLIDGHQADAPALLFRDQQISFGDLRDHVYRLAGALCQRFCKGDRIGLWSDNSPFYVVAYLATIRAGLCAVPFPPAVDEMLFRSIIADTDMRAAFVQQKYLRNVTKWAADLAILDEHAVGKAAFHEIDSETDLAVLAYTSGSTGIPKAVMVTHRNIEANTSDIVSYLGLTPQDRVMAVLPLSYCFGASLLHTHLRAGASVAIGASFMFPDKVLDEMVSKRCTNFAGVPSSYQILLRKSGFACRRFNDLRFLQQAGGKLAASIIHEIAAAQPDIRFFAMYGQTEATARLSYLEPSLSRAKAGSIGRGLPSTTLEVLRSDGTPIVPGSEESGEIVASGANITRGYWRSPQETARYFRNGKLHTGDMARMDADGYLYVVDRARDFIKSMGNRISPQEVEETLATHPEVLHAAVIGVPDEFFGEAVVAFVVPRTLDRIVEADLLTHCNRRLANHKVPRKIYLVDSLPMNSFGKVLKLELCIPESLELSLATQA